MRVLHTSDWHLGRELKGRRRYEEFSAFLEWLGGVIRREKVDTLLVAGDLFDTATPGSRAQALYYRFLVDATAGGCRHVIVIAGNHDSPALIDAPRDLLEPLDIHVIGEPTTPEREVIVLRDQSGQMEGIVCAVPYLPDRFVRSSVAGENFEEREARLLAGIRRHYEAVFEHAFALREAPDVPVIAMGHLFTAGGRTGSDDGVRPLYVGSLDAVDASLFPDELAYTALGHLHIPQTVAGNEAIRYSGSPLPMGFGEAGQTKQVCLIDFEGGGRAISTLAVPVFRRLFSLSGTLPELENQISTLALAGEHAWLEVNCTGGGTPEEFRRRTAEAVSGSGLEILVLRDVSVAVSGELQNSSETLDDLDETEVFSRLLTAREVPDEERDALRSAFAELLRDYREKERAEA